MEGAKKENVRELSRDARNKSSSVALDKFDKQEQRKYQKNDFINQNLDGETDVDLF